MVAEEWVEVNRIKPFIEYDTPLDPEPLIEVKGKQFRNNQESQCRFVTHCGCG
jgi:hypothetical protein